MFIVGLTGGIGSGKSTIADFFRRYVDVIDADEVARAVVQPGMPPLKAIAAHFGEKTLNADGTLNRTWLRHKIFSRPDEKAWLEQLLHPIIRTEIVHALHNSRSPYTVLVSPLLLETDQHLLVDRVLVVDAPAAAQIARVVQRDQTSEPAVRAIMDTQLGRAERLQKADDIIINTADVGALEKSVAKLHNIYSRS